LSWIERRGLAVAVALVALASVRIVATYTVFTHTSDEPAHIACGMEWLDRGVYQWEPQHPPLARVAAALGPYLLGIRSQGTPPGESWAMLREGIGILYHGHHYDLTLALARLGILPFFWIACAVVYWWARRDFGPAVAAAAVFLFSFLPPVLAHAGLATTDMALTAFLGAAFVSGAAWLERPTWRRALGFGVSTGLMVLSKFSSFVFFPACVAGALAWHLAAHRSARGLRQRLPTLALAVAAALLTIWAGYRFSLVPALFQGIQQVRDHNAAGHASYLLGERSMDGFWYFYEVALAVKTPLAFLLLLGCGAALAWRDTRFRRLGVPLAFAGALLVAAMFSRINIGVRHVLPVYLAFAVVAAAALVRGLELGAHSRPVRIALAVAVLWLAASSALAHPDYLPYFNELAASEPEKVLVDSDLDWGQDMKRAARRLQQAGAREVTFEPTVIAYLQKEHGFPHLRPMDLSRPNPGWNLVSFTDWKVTGFQPVYSPTKVVPWPDRYPPGERVGKSMMLWYVP
jgi:4-amino-4-deoxy-L-arabinose transferase-like glycosyltransferase